MRHPDTSTSQLLVIRSISSTIVMLVAMNVKTKHYMYDSIPRDQIKTLTFRIVQGIFNMYCAYIAIKYFPLVFVSLIQNIAPLLVVLFSYILYKQGLSCTDTIILFVSFFGVIILITGSFSDSSSSQPEQEAVPPSTLILPAILLLTTPFNQCAI
jgi:drug/metabolite transporter (DMT)-like permease